MFKLDNYDIILQQLDVFFSAYTHKEKEANDILIKKNLTKIQIKSDFILILSTRLSAFSILNLFLKKIFFYIIINYLSFSIMRESKVVDQFLL